MMTDDGVLLERLQNSKYESTNKDTIVKLSQSSNSAIALLRNLPFLTLHPCLDKYIPCKIIYPRIYM